MPDCEIESAMSDDSDIARSMRRRRRDWGDGPGEEPQEVIAMAYFESCLALHQLYLVDCGCPTQWRVNRSSDGSVQPFEYPDPADSTPSFPISYESIQEHRQWSDGDAFPKMLSFPREILTYRTDQDPPDYGRVSLEEREARVRSQVLSPTIVLTH